MPVNYSSLSTSSANWTYIATAAPSAAASFTFSSISGYKKLKIFGYGYGSLASTYWLLQFNSDAGGNYFGSMWGTSIYMSNSVFGLSPSSTYIPVVAGAQGAAFFNFEINNANSTQAYKDGYGTTISTQTPSYAGTTAGIWKSTSAITSMTVTPQSGTVTGNFYLMGQN